MLPKNVSQVISVSFENKDRILLIYRRAGDLILTNTARATSCKVGDKTADFSQLSYSGINGSKSRILFGSAFQVQKHTEDIWN